ncbi:peptide deformylase [Acinetobacter sp. TGL-Y2]|uniref:peptide deformylase n=1 Tax=Acinetobacter sp. TGL-Y2 TaxID=1407071 RepID=UPI0007A67207|nr:peptide deformylase [Acinetobacter sp. TGL-Y2]AMW78146.1 peptide deformylase [Acinetobacter sp. TGL-Y2]
MTILNIAQRGEAILTLVTAPVVEAEFSSPWLIGLIDALQDTMLAYNGVGIAAPQCYVSKRLIIVASRPSVRYPEAPEMQPIVMVNPEIVALSEQMLSGEEGCLSVENERGQVLRAETVTVLFYSVEGQPTELTLSGFPARIVQHEIDHLNGVLFVDRL